ncbi:MAG: hypothetical protein FWH00_02360 [Oscillospiraceae bacterium]|nr:hypothetical protein [Oscillospiraceae bacterium]
MKRIAILTLVCLLLVLAGCESRPTGGGNASSLPGESPANPPQSASPPPAEVPSAGQPTESTAAGPARDAITDPGLVILARNTVAELLERAALADLIYRAQLAYDSSMSPMVWDDHRYQPVTDERFYTLEDIREFLDSTFIRGGEATRRFDELQNSDAVYMPFNGELYVNIEPRMTPLTLGGWDIDTLELLLMEDREIEVMMQTTMLGKPEGPKILRIIRDGDNWLLGDSFFLD